MERLQIPGSVTSTLVSISQTAAACTPLMHHCCFLTEVIGDLYYLSTVFVRVLWQVTS